MKWGSKGPEGLSLRDRQEGCPQCFALREGTGRRPGRDARRADGQSCGGPSFRQCRSTVSREIGVSAGRIRLLFIAVVGSSWLRFTWKSSGLWESGAFFRLASLCLKRVCLSAFCGPSLESVGRRRRRPLDRCGPPSRDSTGSCRCEDVRRPRG